MTDLVLRPITEADETVCWAAHRELAEDDFTFLLNVVEGEPWADYVARLERWCAGTDVPKPFVPAALLLAEVDGEVVGRSSIRYELNDWLAAWGGHIGYAVRPAFRRRGYAVEILQQSLIEAREHGVQRALVCCDDANLASAAVIERCGGVLEDVRESDGMHPRSRRYWIDAG